MEYTHKNLYPLTKDPTSAVAWHPTKNIIAFGLMTGVIKLATIHNNKAKIFATIKKAHTKQVTALT